MNRSRPRLPLFNLSGQIDLDDRKFHFSFDRGRRSSINAFSVSSVISCLLRSSAIGRQSVLSHRLLFERAGGLPAQALQGAQPHVQVERVFRCTRQFEAIASQEVQPREIAMSLGLCVFTDCSHFFTQRSPYLRLPLAFTKLIGVLSKHEMQGPRKCCCIDCLFQQQWTRSTYAPSDGGFRLMEGATAYMLVKLVGDGDERFERRRSGKEPLESFLGSST
jgi:hypothetical protein